MRLIVKGTLTLFLLLLISIPLSAQYVVQGVVTDSLTKEPLPYASVRLKDTTEGTTTGSDGRFYFKTNRSQRNTTRDAGRVPGPIWRKIL